MYIPVFVWSTKAEATKLPYEGKMQARVLCRPIQVHKEGEFEKALFSF